MFFLLWLSDVKYVDLLLYYGLYVCVLLLVDGCLILIMCVL